MRTYLISIVSAILIGIVGYLAGGYITAKNLARDTNYTQLLWLTAIDRNLQDAKIDQAREIAQLAADGAMALLEGLDKSPIPIFMTVTGAFDMTEQNERTAAQAKKHFLPISENMSPESKQFLKNIGESDLSASDQPDEKEGES